MPNKDTQDAQLSVSAKKMLKLRASDAQRLEKVDAIAYVNQLVGALVGLLSGLRKYRSVLQRVSDEQHLSALNAYVDALKSYVDELRHTLRSRTFTPFEVRDFLLLHSQNLENLHAQLVYHLEETYYYFAEYLRRQKLLPRQYPTNLRSRKAAENNASLFKLFDHFWYSDDQPVAINTWRYLGKHIDQYWRRLLRESADKVRTMEKDMTTPHVTKASFVDASLREDLRASFRSAFSDQLHYLKRGLLGAVDVDDGLLSVCAACCDTPHDVLAEHGYLDADRRLAFRKHSQVLGGVADNTALGVNLASKHGARLANVHIARFITSGQTWSSVTFTYRIHAGLVASSYVTDLVDETWSLVGTWNEYGGDGRKAIRDTERFTDAVVKGNVVVVSRDGREAISRAVRGPKHLVVDDAEPDDPAEWAKWEPVRWETGWVERV